MPTRPSRRPYSAARLVRRRRRLHGSALAVLLVLLISSLLDHRGTFKYQGNDWSAFDHQSCAVTRVVDGDTLLLRPPAGGAETKVRLLGIDAPELHDRETGRPAYWSDRATAYLAARAQGKQVIVRLEPTTTRDKYGRLLAYLYSGENENLNLSLVRDGQAYADRRFRHTLRPQFEQAENEARSKRRGLWKEVAEDQMPPWRRRWLTEVRGTHVR